MIDLLETRRVKQAIDANPGAVADILESTPLAICITNDQGNFIHVNRNYCQLYGYSREELVGQSFVLVVPTERRDFMKKLHDQFIRDKQEIGRTWTVVGKDGQPIQIDVDTGYTDKLGGPSKITLIQKL